MLSLLSLGDRSGARGGIPPPAPWLSFRLTLPQEADTELVSSGTFCSLSAKDSLF